MHNIVQFDRIHCKLTGFDNHAKVFNLRYSKGAFPNLRWRLSLTICCKTHLVCSVWMVILGE